MTISTKTIRQVELSARRLQMVRDHPSAWTRMIRSWTVPRDTDAVWLMYAGNYLFNTSGLKWAVDPVLLSNRVPEAPTMEVLDDLRPLSFILLTHAHVDHVDLRLWNQLRGLDCQWIVPEHMISFFLRETSMERGKFTVAVPSLAIDTHGIRILPFAGLHREWTADGEIQVPATGYLVEVGQRRYLLPGDVRTYNATALADLGPVNAVFAHLFLGRSAALEPSPPLLDAFVDFYRACRPRKVLLTHLYELSRDPEDCWLELHAQQVVRAFSQVDARIEVEIPNWYDEVALSA
jgi:hypothetical protein